MTRGEKYQGCTVLFLNPRGEAFPAADGACDVLLASLSLMYVIDRATAAREMARGLRPGGHFVAAGRATMGLNGDGPRHCHNVTQFLVGQRR